jgi:Tfp pilus assembly protein PilX
MPAHAAMRHRIDTSGVLGRLLRDERGISLILAIVISSTFALSTAAVATFMTSNEGASTRTKDINRALNVAEAGLNDAISVLTQQDSTGSQAIGATLPTTSISLDGASGSYWATKTTATDWTVYGDGTSPDGRVTRHLSLTVHADISTTTTPASGVYRYGFFVAATTGCTSISGNTPVQVPVFVNNDLCLSGNASISEPGAGSGTLDVYVGGHYIATSGPFVGSSSRRIRTFTSPNPCNVQSRDWPCSTSGNSKVWANTYSSTPSTLVKPVADAAAVYASGRWSSPNCTVGSFTFDDDSTRNGSLGPVDLFQSNTRPSFDCTVSNTSGVTVGRLTWNVLTKVLTISGTIFLDGGLNFSGQSQASYTGFGTIYANGAVTTNGQAALCGPPTIVSGSSCTGQWLPSLATLEIVALNGWVMSGQSEFDLIAYVNGNYSASGGAMVTGPVIADTATLSGISKFSAITDPPAGAPGSGETVTTTSWRAIPGSWRQLTNP